MSVTNPNSTIGVGIRRGVTTLGPRNYEPNGGALYKSNHDKFDYLGTNYATAVTIPFDITTSSPNRYSLDAYMEQMFNAGVIYPIT